MTKPMNVGVPSLMTFLLSLGLSAGYIGLVISEYSNFEGFAFHLAARIAVVLLAVLGLAGALSRTEVKISKFYLLLLLFIFLYAMRTFYDFFYSGKLERASTVDYIFFVVAGIAIPVLAIGFAGKLKIDKIARSVTTVFCLCALLLSIKFLFGGVGNIRAIAVAERTADPLSIGYLGAITFSLCLSALITSADNRRIFLLASVVASFYLIGISGSRGALVALVVSTAFIFCSVLSTQRVKANFLLAGLVACGLMSLFYVTGGVDSGVERFALTTDRIEAGREPRWLTYSHTANLILENPVLGYGVELPGGKSPHNSFLESALALGVVGFLLFSVVVAGALKGAWRLGRDKHAVWVGAAFLVVFTQSLFSSTLYYNVPLWMLMGLIVAGPTGRLRHKGG